MSYNGEKKPCVGCLENQANQLAHTCMMTLSQESSTDPSSQTSSTAQERGDTAADQNTTTADTFSLSPNRRTFMEALLEEYETQYNILLSSKQEIQHLREKYRKLDHSSLCEFHIRSALAQTVPFSWMDDSPRKRVLERLSRVSSQEQHNLSLYNLAKERLQVHQIYQNSLMTTKMSSV